MTLLRICIAKTVEKAYTVHKQDAKKDKGAVRPRSGRLIDVSAIAQIKTKVK